LALLTGRPATSTEAEDKRADHDDDARAADADVEYVFQHDRDQPAV